MEKQVSGFTVGETFTLQISAASGSGDNTKTLNLAVSVDGTAVVTAAVLQQWTRYEGTFVAQKSSLRIIVQATFDVGVDSTIFIDTLAIGQAAP